MSLAETFLAFAISYVEVDRGLYALTSSATVIAI